MTIAEKVLKAFNESADPMIDFVDEVKMEPLAGSLAQKLSDTSLQDDDVDLTGDVVWLSQGKTTAAKRNDDGGLTLARVGEGGQVLRFTLTLADINVLHEKGLL